MKQAFKFLMFFVVFLSVYLGMHAYVYLKLVKILPYPVLLMWIFAVMIIGFPLVNVLERMVDGRIVRYLLIFSSVWFGLVFFMDIGALLVDFIRLFPVTDEVTLIWIMVSLVGVVAVYSLFNARNIYVKKIKLKVKGLPKSLDGLRIVQLSDIHVGSINTSKYLEKIVKMSNKLKPDIVAITGDLFDGTGQKTGELVRPLKRLKASKGSFFVTGNHEFYLDSMGPAGSRKMKSTDYVKETGVEVVDDKVKNIGKLQVIGVSHPTNDFSKGVPGLKRLKDKISKDKFSLLLYHLPHGLKEGARYGVDLQLSGHTHKGQIWPFGIIEKPFHKYLYGLFEHKGSYLYVSSGAGTWGPPMRLGSRSEIVLFEIKKKKK